MFLNLKVAESCTNQYSTFYTSWEQITLLQGYIDLLLLLLTGIINTMLVPVLILKLLFSLSRPYDTGFGCHGVQPGIHAVYDKGFNVGGPVLDYSNTEIRSPWRGGGYNAEPFRQSRLLMLDSINTDPQPAPSFHYSNISHIWTPTGVFCHVLHQHFNVVGIHCM